MSTRTEQMKGIRDKVTALTDSPLYTYRVENKYFPVIGEGSHYAEVMFIGEAPGKNEAKTGRPFCGRAGEILNSLLSDAGMKREEVYITNIVKDRPPENRDPLPEEIKIYGPFLDQQIAVIQPKVIATLGRYAMNYIFSRFGLQDVLLPISAMHGKMFLAKAPYGEVTLAPLYHPAVAIYNMHMKETLIEDFKIIKTALITQ